MLPHKLWLLGGLTHQMDIWILHGFAVNVLWFSCSQGQLTWRSEGFANSLMEGFPHFFFFCRGGRSVILAEDWQMWCAQLPLTHQQIAVGDRSCGSVASQGPGHVLGYHPPPSPNGQTVLTVQWTLSHTFIGHRRIQIFQHIRDIGVLKGQQPLLVNATLILTTCWFWPHSKWLRQLVSTIWSPCEDNSRD